MKGQPNYRNVTECRCLIQGMHCNVTKCNKLLQNVMECRCLIYRMQQNVTECRCLFSGLLRNIEAETTDVMK